MKKIWMLMALAAVTADSTAQNLSNKGKEFWVGYGHHQFMEPGQSNSQQMVIYLSAEEAANVTVSINGTAWVRNYSIPANTVITTEFLPKAGTDDCRLFSLPPSFGGTGGEGIFSRGIHIESDVPIVAYAHIFGSASSGATMLMPTNTWGYVYQSVNSQQVYGNNNCFSWIYVVAEEDNTVIEITPSVPTRNGRPAGVPFTETLNRGQIYQVIGASISSSTGHEMSGTKVRSVENSAGTCHPIAVFAGSSRTSITCPTPSSGSGDNIMQQIFPYQAWGKRYLTAPTSVQSSASSFATNIYRIAVKDPTTVVKRNGVTLTGLTPQNYYQYTSNTADYIEADKPILVAQYMSSSGSCGNSGYGDPEMMYISPIEQGIKRVGFFRNDDENISINYLTLIIPTAGLASLQIDGATTYSHTYPHPNLSGYTVVVRRWNASKAQCLVQSDSAFTAITYGIGSVESYGYNAGTLINNLAAVGAIHNVLDPSVDEHDFTCENTPMELSVLMAYQPTNMVWQLSTLASVLTPSADVTVASPTPVGTVMVNGIQYYKYTLPGTYEFNTPGIYEVPILSTHPSIENCNNTETVTFNVDVRGKPGSDFTVSYTGCALDTVHFSGAATSANGFDIAEWNWEFPGPLTSSAQDTSVLFPPGVHDVYLTVISEDGCVGDTTTQISIFDAPLAYVVSDPTELCVGASVEFSDTAYSNGSNPVNEWWWDFGDGNTVTSTSGPTVTHTYTAPGTYTVKHVGRSSATCVSDTVSRTVTVHASPVASFTYPSGCVDVTGLVQLNGTGTSSDGQAITGYAWNFGDPNADAGNPNTSTDQNPTHNYQPGTYDIQLTVTTENGCTHDTTEQVTFNLMPAMTYPALNNICENEPPVSIATASVTNGVTGSGTYTGPGTDAAGMFDPAAAGVGTHTVWYHFVSGAGCEDSVSQTINVHAAPVPSFTLPGGGCLEPNGLVQFTNTSTIADAQTLTYSWDFDDPNATGGNPNTSTDENPTHIYQEGSYDITLTVNSSNGCSASVTEAANFSVKPALNYPALTALCENAAAPVSVATATVTNGVTGNGTYSGPGTDAAGMFDASVAGAGTHTIWYHFTTNGGCTDSISQTIDVHAAPVPSFTVPGGGCLEPDGQVQFTNTTTIADAQTLTYSWNFGDPNADAGNPNTSTDPNPIHYYLEGNYDITLTATSSNGCVETITQNATFSVKPDLTYPALAAVCENTASVSVAGASVTNGITGTGVYSGPGTDAAGVFDPAAAGPGIHTITYSFTTAGGCTETITQTIEVYAAPVPSFTLPAGGCLDPTGLAQFTSTSTIADAQTLTYSWNFGDPNADAGNPNTSTVEHPTHSYLEGNYDITLTVTSSNGCVASTTQNATFSVTPALDYTALTSICENEAPVSVAQGSVTNGITGTGVYSGPGTDAAGMFDPSVAGPGTHTITYTFTSTGGCTASITQTIEVLAAPVPAFTFPNNCLDVTGLVQFVNNSTIADAQTLTYSWDFDDPNATGGNPNTSTLQNPTHNYTGHGTYDVTLVVNSSSGCTASLTQSATFSVTPQLDWQPLPDACESDAVLSIATATVTNNVPGTGVYSGPGTDAAGMFDPGVAGAGTHTIVYTFTSPGGCEESVSQNITVHAKPQASFTYPNGGCLDPDGLAQFTNTSTIADAQTLTYSWNFGDPNANGGNPNTSTLEHPSHYFTQEGSYTIQLTVTSSQGCTDVASVTADFSLLPDLSYPALAPVCESQQGAVSLASAVVVNGATGTGVYGGPGMAADGMFTPSTAGAGTHSVWYEFTTTGGCKDTVYQTVTVYPKPVAAFTISSDICIDGEATFTDQSTVPSGSITSWEWDFGDGNTATYTNGNTFTRGYSAWNTYQVTLVAVSDNGCESDPVSKSVIVHPLPVADFDLPAGICMPGGEASFTNTSSVEDNVALSYVWNFGDGSAASNDTDPTHVYASSGSYTVQLTAITAHGCANQTSQVLDDFFDKPQAMFSVTPEALCEGEENVFTDMSTAPNSSVNAWEWNFGDGSSDNTASPVKTFDGPGVFNVSLTVTNAVGCTSDPYIYPVTVYLQPVIDAGPSFVVPQGTTVVFQPQANDTTNLEFMWTPSIDFTDPTQFTQSLVAMYDQNYTLTAVGEGGCTASDMMSVKILKPIVIPNSFSPNGDGTNDTWVIENLHEYPGATVEVFNRYGQPVFKSSGYPEPWDGRMNGKDLPVATYYYVIHLKNGFKPLSGWVLIVR